MIKARPVAPMPPHINPSLKTGELYEVISSGVPAARDYRGRVFTYLAASGDIVWLADGQNHGGYDAESLIRKYRLDFRPVTVQLV